MLSSTCVPRQLCPVRPRFPNIRRRRLVPSSVEARRKPNYIALTLMNDAPRAANPQNLKHIVAITANASSFKRKSKASRCCSAVDDGCCAIIFNASSLERLNIDDLFVSKDDRYIGQIKFLVFNVMRIMTMHGVAISSFLSC